MLLVSTPKIIDLVWPKEVAKWRVRYKNKWQDLSDIITLSKVRGAKWEEGLNADADIYLTTFDLLEKVCYEVLRRFQRGNKIDVLAVDEITKIKNSKTQRFKNIKPVLDLFDTRIGMTGNLIPHSYMDLWSQIFILDLGKSLGEDFTRFQLTHFLPAGYYGKGWRLADGEEALLVRKIKHLVCRIGPEELDEPPLYHVPRYVRLSDKAMEQYREMEEEFILDLEHRGEGAVVATTAGAAHMKLRQITGGAVYQSSEYQKGRKVIHLHDEKIEDLRELVDELNGEPILVAYAFIHELDRLKKAFPSASCIGGKLNNTQNSKIEDDWNAGRIPILLAPIDGISHGQNMQGHGRYIYIFSDTFNWENHFQFTKRVHRTGQKSPVTIFHSIAEGTVDEVLFRASKEKDCNQERLWEMLQQEYLNKGGVNGSEEEWQDDEVSKEAVKEKGRPGSKSRSRSSGAAKVTTKKVRSKGGQQSEDDGNRRRKSRGNR